MSVPQFAPRWWENAQDLASHDYRVLVAGRVLVVPLATFQEAMDEYMQAHRCNYQVATQELLHVWRWHFTVSPPRCNTGKVSS